MFAKFLFTLKDLLNAVVAALVVVTQYVEKFTRILEDADRTFNQSMTIFESETFSI